MTASDARAAPGLARPSVAASSDCPSRARSEPVSGRRGFVGAAPRATARRRPGRGRGAFSGVRAGCPARRAPRLRSPPAASTSRPRRARRCARSRLAPPVRRCAQARAPGERAAEFAAERTSSAARARLSPAPPPPPSRAGRRRPSGEHRRDDRGPTFAAPHSVFRGSRAANPSRPLRARRGAALRDVRAIESL
jgi:hypothetical protein